MLTRQHRARAPIPARVAEHRHQQLRPRRPQQLRRPQQQRPPQQPRPPQPQRPPLQRLQCPGRHLHQGLVRHRRRDRSEFRNSFVGEADSFPLQLVSDLRRQGAFHHHGPEQSIRMVIGWRQFDAGNQISGKAASVTTTDGGLNWTFPSVLQPGALREFSSYSLVIN